MNAREIQVNADHEFTFRYFLKAIQIIPTTATISIFDNEGNTIIDEEDADIADEGTITYTFEAASNATEGKNFKITVTVDDVKHTYLFDVVKHPILNECTDEDLFQYLEEMRTKIFDRNGATTDLGTTSTLIDQNLIADQRINKGGFLTIFISDQVEFKARITDFDSETGTLSFEPEYEDDISSNIRYILRGSYSAQIDKAFELVRKDIRKKVKLMAGYIDSASVVDLVAIKALELYSFSSIENVSDKWDIRYREFKTMYGEKLASFLEPYDEDEDGNIDSTENDERPAFVNIGVRR